jgi:hypothetical protein
MRIAGALGASLAKTATEAEHAEVHAAIVQTRLEKVRIGVLDAVPSTSLGKKLCCHKIDDMPATDDAFPEGLVGVLTGRIMMLVEPGRMPGFLQFLENGKRQSVAILSAMRKKYVMGAAWNTSDFPVPDHSVFSTHA